MPFLITKTDVEMKQMAFNLFKRKKAKNTLEIVAPMNGEIIPLEKVPDPVFSQKMMGEGIGMIPADGRVCSPIAGKVILVADTKHAVGLQADDGTELLIHIGLDTVALKGEGFALNVEEGQTIEQGEPLVTFDLDLIREKATSIVTPVIITNSQTMDGEIEMTTKTNGVQGETVLITISK